MESGYSRKASIIPRFDEIRESTESKKQDFSISLNKAKEKQKKSQKSLKEKESLPNFFSQTYTSDDESEL